MIKIIKKQRRKKLSEALQSKKKVLLMILVIGILVIFLMNFVSGEWQDNFYDDLVAWYPLDDNTNVHDTGVNLTLSNGTGTYSPGLIGNALDGDYIYGQGSNFNIIAADDTESFSVCFWTEGDDAGSEGVIGFDDALGTTVDSGIFGGGHLSGGNAWQWTINGAARTSQTIIRNGWQHHCIVYNSSVPEMLTYHNGSLNSSNTSSLGTWNDGGIVELVIGAYKNDGSLQWDGQIDEIGIWNRTLNATEITGLYNNTEGVTYGNLPTIPSISIDLISPEDGKAVSTTPANFTANYTATNSNLTNTTYYIWNSTGIFNNTVFVEITGTSNSTTEPIGNLVLGNYEWNVWACYENATFSNCSFADANYSFQFTGFTITGESYENETIEGNLEIFSINITVETEFQISTAHLVYNNTLYLGSWENLGGGDYRIYRNLVIPNIAADVNNTFYWSFLMENAFVTFTTNSTVHNQSVKAFAIDDCSSYSILLLNYTFREEKTQDFLNETTENTTIELDLDIYPVGSSTSILNFSQNYSRINPVQVCLKDYLNHTEYRMYTQARYESKDTIAEFSHIQNFTLTNATIPQNINLFGLNRSQSQKFMITFKNANFLPVEDALIDIQRKYVDEGVFKSVEIPITDEYGKTIGHFDLDGVIYTIIVSKYGEVLATFDNIAVICQDIIIQDCRLELNAVTTGVPFTEWEEIGGITYTIDFDEDTRTITVVFSTTDGSVSTMLLNTTKFDRFGNETVCSDDLTSSSGTLTCVVPASFGNLTVVSKLYNDGVLVTTRTYSINPEAGDYFGTDVLVMVLILMITIPLMFVTSPIGVIIGVILGLIMAGALLILKGSILGTVSAIIWAILAGGIIIWKIARRET